MALILNIDTALETGSVSLARDGATLSVSYNDDQKDHASWLHTAVNELFNAAGATIKQLDAVAVTSGPGSYTGIRVGMASAKGLAYALKIPLITLNTLQVMTHSIIEYNKTSQEYRTNNEILQSVDENLHPDQLIPGEKSSLPGNLLFCPMIDARRDEVFTAVYDNNCEPVMVPSALKLAGDSYARELETAMVLFFGNGSDKWKEVSHHPNARFQKWDYAYFNLAYLSQVQYDNRAFADLAYVQPEYLKDFFTYKKN
jgi:tRNA threonylcarbamoyladenosine biosynthesis protein TsaB